MPLVKAQCTNCGATLDVDSAHDAAVCKFCGTPFIVEKAINNYNTTNVTNIHTDNLSINANSIDDMARAADTFMTLKDYVSAEKIYRKLTETAPYDSRGWWGLVRIKTTDFSDYLITEEEYAEIADICDKYKTVAEKSDIIEKQAIIQEYESNIVKTYDEYYEEYNRNLEIINNHVSKIKSKQTDLNQKNQKSNKIKKISVIIMAFAMLIADILLIVLVKTDFAASFFIVFITILIFFTVKVWIQESIKNATSECNKQLKLLDKKHTAIVADNSIYIDHFGNCFVWTPSFNKDLVKSLRRNNEKDDS